MSKGSAVVAILIAFVGGLAIGNLVGGRNAGGEGSEVAQDDSQGALPANGPEETDRFYVPVTRDQPSKGPADALVTIVEFSDFQCPFCSARRADARRSIVQEYGGKVRVVWRNNPLPFHQNARPAAEAAMEAMRAGRQRQVLADARHALREPAGARAPEPRAATRSRSAST